MSSWITMPDNDECHKIAADFEKKTHIPQLIGAIDGTHIPILPPSDGYRDFINRKGWPSMILQVVVDNKYRFRNIYCGSPGSCHDAAVFQTSKLYKNHNLLIPKETKIILNVPVPYLIIGDPAYPLLEWLIKGYTKCTRLTPEEESFNVYLNSARVCVEIAFGRLKARWRRVLKRIDVHYTYVPYVISAVCILHNIVETRNDTFLSAWEHAIREIQQAEVQQPELRRTRNLDNFNAIKIRDTLNTYLAENFELRRTFVT
ncbi:protein ALP1-like isoform X1 [Solenopsis invicta]|uniref:protein ALP1-like isoform X1 n=1 Tax=Solenopsis invicta TaxID=13686 RepID=UPI00193D7A22|nr:protein ALP1-like isoform X1 [Solenopsis invicta]